MTNLTDSTIDRARRNVHALHRNLNALSQALKRQDGGMQKLWTIDQHSSPAQARAHARQQRLASGKDAVYYFEHLGSLMQELSSSLDTLRADLNVEEREQQQLRGLFKVSQAINATLDLNALLHLVMDTLIEVMGAERGFLLLFDPSGRELAAAVARNMDRSTIQGTDHEISRSISSVSPCGSRRESRA